LPRGPALTGGLIFAIAPYRVEQSVGHLLGPISIMLPLALWAVERARRGTAWWLALAGAAITSIPLSGQVHLALGAIPFFLCYGLVRLLPGAGGVHMRHRSRGGGVHIRRRRLVAGTVAGVLAAIGAGILVRQTVIAHSTQAGGRSLTEVKLYSARWSDFVTRHVDHARSEQFIYLGWATPLLALLGLVLLVRNRRIGLAAVLALGALVPILLAVGTRLPVYSALWHALPPFRFPRVPERLLPIASLCLAGLGGYAIARARVGTQLLSVLAIALVFLDLHARVYGRSDPGIRPTAGIAAAGRLLELPLFDPGIHYGSVYLWDDTAVRRQRPGGYSTSAPLAAKTTAERLERLNCGDWSDATSNELARLGVSTIALHLGLYVHNSAVPNVSYFAWRGLLEHGWSLRAVTGSVWIFGRGGHAAFPTLRAPSPREPVFCQGWYGDTGSGRFMSERHAPFWFYGAGLLRVRFAPSSLARRFTVDGRPQFGPTLALGRRGWHVLAVDVPRLVPIGGKKVGLRLVGLSTSPSRGSRSRRTGSSP
jgi:hypothetical protein